MAALGHERSFDDLVRQGLACYRPSYRYRSTSTVDTGAPPLPHDARKYVSTAETSLSLSFPKNGGMPYGRGLADVTGGWPPLRTAFIALAANGALTLGLRASGGYAGNAPSPLSPWHSAQ